MAEHGEPEGEKPSHLDVQDFDRFCVACFRKRWFLLDVVIVGVDWTFMAATIGADSAKVVH